jgi:L-lactate dehydrogenase complex protein LldG
MTEPKTTGMGSRDAIFASMRRSLAASRPFDEEHQKYHRPSAPPRLPSTPILPVETLIENFRSSLASVGTELRVVESGRDVAREVHAIAEGLGAKRIAASDSPLVAESTGAIAGVEILSNAPAAELFDYDLGITSAQWAIAETGTLVLESEHERHRLTSLVPPVHLCILKAGNIRQTLGEILDLVSKDLNRAVTFITGASRTSDIELTLAIGVHGPKELHVIVVND